MLLFSFCSVELTNTELSPDNQQASNLSFEPMYLFLDAVGGEHCFFFYRQLPKLGDSIT